MINSVFEARVTKIDKYRNIERKLKTDTVDDAAAAAVEMKNRWRDFFILPLPLPRQTTFRFTACCLVTACYCLITVTVWHVEFVQSYITLTKLKQRYIINISMLF